MTFSETLAHVDPFPGYPRGWFVVALSEEVVTDAPLTLRYFGQDLVAFREQSGAAVVQAALPRLASGVAPQAFRVVERNGFVFVHYDPRGREPEYEIPVVPQVGHPQWTAWQHGKLRLRTHSREIVENVVDVAHFRPVHKNDPAEFVNEFVGHRAIQRSEGHGMGQHAGTGYRLEATYYGPSFQVTEMHSVVETVLYNTHTMVDEAHVDLRFGLMMQPGSQGERFSEDYVREYVSVVMHGFRQDARIWEHKRWRDRPVLCDGDGPIMQLRAWYAQYFD